jgi:membrane-bound serine protease (ClpP class)
MIFIKNKYCPAYLLFLFILFLLNSHELNASIYHFHIEGPITPATVEITERVINDNLTETDIVIIQMNTPGGLMDSMNKITSKIINSECPVIVWVGPKNSHATSAGAFIAAAAHITVMAEACTIGSAHPVSLFGKMDDSVKEKITNYAAVTIRTLAQKSGKPDTPFAEMVINNLNLSSEQALDTGLIDFIANDITHILNQINGYKINFSNKSDSLIVSTENLKIIHIKPTLKENFLNLLCNPNIIYILALLGIYGFIYEFSVPGIGLGFTMGTICLILAAYGFSLIPINVTGIMLILAGIILLILEAFTPSFGILGIGGICSVLAGSFFLYEQEVFRVSIQLISGFGIGSSLLLIYILKIILQQRKIKTLTGYENFSGKPALVCDTLNPEGQIFFNGAIWSAVSSDNSIIEKDARVEILYKKGHLLFVKKL